MQSQKGQEFVQLNARIPPELRDKINKLAAWEGAPAQEVIRSILEMYFEGIGEIPDRKSILAKGWPGKPLRK